MRDGCDDFKAENTRSIQIRDSEHWSYYPYGHTAVAETTPPFNCEIYDIRVEDNGNIHLRPYSRVGFLNDLIECNGVISNAGFELASEAMSLGKKILVKPLAGQMEQISNALAITSLNLGMAMKRLCNFQVAQILGHPPGAPISFPNVARMIAEWIEKGEWEDVEGLALKAWGQTVLPG